MCLKVCLVACFLSVGQGTDRSRWPLTPQLGRGHELVYSGSYVEQSLAPGVGFRREYRVQTRAIVLTDLPNGWEVAFLTAVNLRRDRAGQIQSGDRKSIGAVHLKTAQVDRQGKFAAPGAGLSLPIDGPPTIERGCIVAAPKGRVGKGREWVVVEPGMPPLKWRVVGTAVVGSTICVKLQGSQQSTDWKNPRADSTAWQRTETVWITPRTGVVRRLVRVLERRGPARIRPTFQSTMRYELDRHLTFPDQLFADRRLDLKQIAQYGDQAEKYLHAPSRYKEKLDRLLQRIAFRAKQTAPAQTPVLRRLALEQIQDRIEAVRRGELVVAPKDPKQPLIPVAKIGNQAPNFLVTDLIHKKTVQLYGFLGRPILLVFYNPKTTTGRRVLWFAKQIQTKHEKNLTVLGMAVTGDVGFVRQQYREMELPFRVLDGRGMHRTFAVDATPRLIVLDAGGHVRFAHTGWGVHIPQEIQTVLARFSKK